MFSKFVGRAALSAGAGTLAAGSTISAPNARCETSTSTSQKRIFKSLRKETTLKRAMDEGTSSESRSLFPIRRTSTRQELSKLRANKDEILLRWERDEDGWRELPSRSWPAYQPSPVELEGIQSQFKDLSCDTDNAGNDFCQDLLFQISTTLVFYNLDPKKGFAQYEKLANQGHVDSMVACGVILVEGLAGIPPEPSKGIEWLRKAILQDSSQGCYELGTCLYTGIDGVLEDDPEGAFALFERAAAKDHTGALYMVADCLVEGEGTEKSISKAVPLFYRAAERGHRFSRQRIRELLTRKEYQ